MIAVRVYRGSSVSEETDTAKISDHVESGDCLVWVDVVEPTEDDLACLQEEFSLHPLAMEDVRHHHQRPKLEDYPTHDFLVAYSSGLQEVDIFVGTNWVLTVRETDEEGKTWPVDAAQQRFERTRHHDAGPGFLVYVVLDTIVDGYFDATDLVEETLEGLEDRIFGEQLEEEAASQEELFDIRRKLLLFRRAVVPLREVLNELLRGKFDWVDPTTQVHLQDVYDHVLRAIDLLDSQRELMGNAVDAHLAIISNRMNQVMKTMTSWGAILLGSTLVAGIYGMNFVKMPELKWYYGYAWALGLMVVLTIVLYRYFKRRDWL